MTTLDGEDLRIEHGRWRIHHRLRVTEQLVDLMNVARGFVRCGPEATASKRAAEVRVAVDASKASLSVYERRLVAAHAAQRES